MRLSDHLMMECGGQNDVGGIFTKTCAAIRDAERFELSDDVARAGYHLTKSKPTTLVSALPLCRAPYRKVWLEWRGGLTSDMIRPEHKRDPLVAPDPLKQGCLIETDKTGQRGVMTFCWLHKTKPERVGQYMYTPSNISPLGAMFNWAQGSDAREDAREELLRRYPTREERSTVVATLEKLLFHRFARVRSEDEIRTMMQRSIFKDWGRFADNPVERKALAEYDRHGVAWISPHAHDFFRWCCEHIRSEEQIISFLKNIVGQSWEPDIEGEPPFAETVIALMNSRNAIEHRSVDLTGLNRARKKRGRPLFLQYQTTHLRLSQAQTRALRAGLMSREQAGEHSVRGHFKVRKTGVYWWSDFQRGDPQRQLKRQEYEIGV
jgi:hypothetical protein